jgi:hypothetical protein
VAKSEGLTRILEKETEYFQQRKVKQAEMLLETKTSLIDELEGLKASLLADSNILRELPESEKLRVKEANLLLMRAADNNFKEATKAQEVNKLILEAISYAVNQSKVVEGAYGDSGNTNKSIDNKPISISTNA